MSTKTRRWTRRLQDPRRYERLRRVSADIGTITAGIMQNAAGSRYVDLDASGSQPFIKHDNFELLANGSATFSGTVSASSFTATTATFSGHLIVQAAGGSLAYWLTDSALYIRDGATQQLALRRGGTSDGIVEATAGDLRLQPNGVVDFRYNDVAGPKTAGNFLPIEVNGTTRYLQLYT